MDESKDIYNFWKGVKNNMREIEKTKLITKIVEHLGMNEILCQLAEEASELAQAALKLRRAYDGKNPTPKTVEECINALLEESADVDLALIMICQLLPQKNEFVWIIEQDRIEDKKVKRWAERLDIEKAGEKI